MRVNLVVAIALVALAAAPAAFGDAVTHQADAVHSGHAKRPWTEPAAPPGVEPLASPTSCPIR